MLHSSDTECVLCCVCGNVLCCAVLCCAARFGFKFGFGFEFGSEPESAGSRGIRSAILTASEHDRYGIDARTLGLEANPKKRLLLEAHLSATGGDPSRLREEWRLIDLGCSTGYTHTSAEGVCPTVLASHGDRALYCTHRSMCRLLSPFESMLIMGFDHGVRTL